MPRLPRMRTTATARELRVLMQAGMQEAALFNSYVLKVRWLVVWLIGWLVSMTHEAATWDGKRPRCPTRTCSRSVQLMLASRPVWGLCRFLWITPAAAMCVACCVW